MILTASWCRGGLLTAYKDTPERKKFLRPRKKNKERHSKVMKNEKKRFRGKKLFKRKIWKFCKHVVSKEYETQEHILDCKEINIRRKKDGWVLGLQ